MDRWVSRIKTGGSAGHRPPGAAPRSCHERRRIEADAGTEMPTATNETLCDMARNCFSAVQRHRHTCGWQSR